MWASVIVAAALAWAAPQPAPNAALATIPFFHTSVGTDGLPSSIVPWHSDGAWLGCLAALLLALALIARAYRARTRRRRAWQTAERGSAAKSDFLVTMAHEIRTPMTGVLGMTELLLQTSLDATQRGYADAIHNSGRILLRLVNDALDLASIEAGKFELDDLALDLHALTHEVAALTFPPAQSKGLQCTLRIDADAPRGVRGDALRIQQVLLNIVNNAIKYTPHGSVQLALMRGQDGTTQFQICDTGPGIASSLQDRVFRRFEQGEAGQCHGGSGLGLAICSELVARMGGRIELHSTHGAGSNFRVTLPLREIDLIEPSESEAGLLNPVAGSAALTFLLVTDDSTVATVISGLLNIQGHLVRHAAQSLAALRELDSGDLQAALIDLDLPGVDGLILARMLRAREARIGGRPLPLIGISARSVSDEEALCLRAGMNALLRQPITGERLFAAVASIVGQTQ
jgi:signal transduction histidine kinase/CheY-like chemotaxis protein